jgi:hypothetical protein
MTLEANMLAEKIRSHARQRYVQPALSKRAKRFSIRAGDVERELGIAGRTPAVCSALKTRRFLEQNNLKLVEARGPRSGQSSTVVYIYEFTGGETQTGEREDAWKRLRGALEEVFRELGGGEAYLRGERKSFYGEQQENA